MEIIDTLCLLAAVAILVHEFIKRKNQPGGPFVMPPRKNEKGGDENAEVNDGKPVR